MVRLLLGLCAVFSAISMAGPSIAKPKIKFINKYYPIRGNTAQQLRQEMYEKGPNGMWAWTRWHVRWNARCKITLRISYTYPKWVNKRQASRALRAKWARMMRNLRVHERGHARHGIMAAREIKRSRCRRDPEAISYKWAQQDKLYDRRTRSGITQGVVLP